MQQQVQQQTSSQPQQLISEEQLRYYEKEGYRRVGNHSAVKVCEWTKKSIRGQDVCYKCQFYGIHSWQCVQMSPTFFCDHRCVFCWRDIKYVFPKWQGPIDDPKDIIDGAIKAQIDYLQGFWGNEKAVKEKLEQAETPMHFAISLTGEPTMYPRLHEMIDELHRRKISSFLVTNGTLPEMVEKLTEHQPTQIYFSVYGPDKETYIKTANPLPADAWERLHKSLSFVKKFKRSVIRLTLTKYYNFTDPAGYARIINFAEPTFVELKGYMWVGHSRERLEPKNMPYWNELESFAEAICMHTGYKIVDKKEISKVILLAKEEFDGRIMQFDV